MKSLKKVAAVTLAASVLLSMAACNSKKNSNQKHSGQKITSDMPWYEASPFEFDAGIDPDRELQYTYSQLIGTDDKNIAILTSGNYKYPDNVDWSTFDSTDYQISRLSILDKATKKTVKFFDLNSVISSGYVDSASYSDGKITLNVSDWDMEKNAMVSKSVDIDPESGKQLDSRDNKGTDSVQSTFTVGKYKVQLCAVWTQDDPIYSLNVISPDGEEHKYEFKDDTAKVTYINSVIPLNDKTGLVIADGDNSYAFYELDLTSGKLTKKDSKDYEWLDMLAVYRMRGCSDGNVYCVDSNGISKLDLKNKTSEQVVSFSWCNVDRNLTSNLMLADVNDGAYILYGEKAQKQPYSHNYYAMSSEFIMYELKKASKNPYVGKTILELYSPYGLVSEDINTAINKYNETNKDYFIEVTDRYTSNTSSLYKEAKNDDESNDIGLKYMSDMSNKLAMDIMNGEGPDMLLNVDGYGALKNSNYLMDLSSYTSNMNSDKYFTNVIDAMKVDGKLFNMPISYGISGIQTDPKYAAKTGVGFTTDEYVKFLKDTLNGKDLITSGQAHYFATLFSNMNEKFISNRKADFSAPEFAALAEFVKDNVPESARSWSNSYYDAYNEAYIYGSEPMIAPVVDVVAVAPVKRDRVVDGSDIAAYVTCGGMSDYIYTLAAGKDCTAILGLPSADGRGPLLDSYLSIAVSAQSKSVDACGEFIKMLMTDDVQMDLAKGGNFVLNKEAFRQGAKEAVDFMNGPGGESYVGYDMNTGEPLKNRMKFSQKNVDDLEKIISSVSRMNSMDAAIGLILVEEMPAYFSGQKNLEDVIKIAQDRAQKVIGERG